MWDVDSSLLVTHMLSSFLLWFCHFSSWEFNTDEATECLQVTVVIHSKFKSARENGNSRQRLRKNIFKLGFNS